MGSIVEWQSLKMQEYRYAILSAIARFFELFGVRTPLRYIPAPVAPGDYDHAIHGAEHDGPSFMQQSLDAQPQPEPRLGGAPKQTQPPVEL
jgi:hypothetical protein